MNEPSPYYETPKDAPSRVRLYHGDCREILPLVAPPSKRVIVLADPPYGVGHTKKSRATRDLAPRPSTTLRAGKNRRWKTLQGDTSAFDPSHLLAYTRLLVWGWNHFGDSLSPTPSVVVWDKRDYVDRDDNADGEIAWTNLGGPARLLVVVAIEGQ